MKINQIILSETTVAGNIGTVSSPIGATRRRTEETVNVRGIKPVNKLKNTTKKSPYANSLNESKMKDLTLDLTAGKDGLSDIEFKKKYGKTKQEMRKSMQDSRKEAKTVAEADLHEEDKIIAVGKGKKLKTGLHGKSEQPKLRGFLPPFKSTGMYVSDKRGNSVCECGNDDLAPIIAKALNAYAIANESITSSATGEEKLNEKFKSKQQAKLMFAVAGDKDVSTKTGVSQKVAKEFVKKSHGQKISKLPTKIKKKE